MQVAVEELRNERASLSREREGIARAPATKEETAENINRALDELEAGANARFSARGFRSDDDPERGLPDLNAVFQPGSGMVGPQGGYFQINSHDLVGGLCVLGLRPLIEPALLAKAIAERPGEGITASERAAKLRKIDADIEAVELAEEQLIREAEEAGITVFRRSDARPEIFLRETI
ncbi:hypothetical protein [Rhizobium sp. IBUN]|uniref:hypothetical protein n=1 Tax=Rhizobium sp. IBUN TaxID=1042326 RepID=UPI0012EC4F6F|nr:hypothetical protein [Rhizobium sp. IBUN]